MFWTSVNRKGVNFKLQQGGGFSYKFELLQVIVELHPGGFYTLLFALRLITMIHPH